MLIAVQNPAVEYNGEVASPARVSARIEWSGENLSASRKSAALASNRPGLRKYAYNFEVGMPSCKRYLKSCPNVVPTINIAGGLKSEIVRSWPKRYE